MRKIAECCCSKLSIELLGRPKIHGVCHCNDCKKRTGSAFGISSYFNNENILKKRGEASCYLLHNIEHEHYQKRYFCKACGTTLFWTISTMPNMTGIAGGCFVDPPLEDPTYSTSHSNICSWLSLPEHWLNNA